MLFYLLSLPAPLLLSAQLHLSALCVLLYCCSTHYRFLADKQLWHLLMHPEMGDDKNSNSEIIL